MKWQWFLGGRAMFWLSIVILIIYLLIFTATFIIDPTTFLYMNVQSTDTTSIKNISEEYVNSLGITIDKPIQYRFVYFKNEKHFKTEYEKTHKFQYEPTCETVLLGVFHEWNGKYYIDVSANLYKMNKLNEVVKHETRHMIVQELKNEKIIDLTNYTEEIAQEKDDIYNNLFDSGVCLLKTSQKEDKK